MAYITAALVMDDAAALMNDVSKSLYTYAVQIPFLKLAYRDMDQEFTANEIEINLISELEQVVTANTVTLPLPTGFFLPISLQEKGTSEGNDFYRPIVERPNINDLQLLPTNLLSYWDYRHNCINFLGSTVDRKVRLYYWRTLADLIDNTSFIEIRGGQSYLAYRTAALMAQFIGGNANRAGALNTEAMIAMDRILAVMIKNNQSKRVRRKPFRRNSTRPTLTVR